MLLALGGAGSLGAAEITAADRAAAAAVFQRDLQALTVREREIAAEAHRREQECLERFFSSPCLESLRQDIATQEQDVRLARAAANRGLRELDALERSERRAAALAKPGAAADSPSGGVRAD